MAGAGRPRLTGRQLDATALSGLAHPLRVQLFEQLTHYGPATATQLAKRLHESSGATSYHLRQLERYGFVETDPGRGSGRERWWRRVAGGILIDSPTMNESPASRDAAALVVNEFQRGRVQRHEHWIATYEEWPEEWQQAAAQGSVHLILTVDELRELVGELDGLLSVWKRRAGDRPLTPDSRSVEFQHAIFPLPSPDEAE